MNTEGTLLALADFGSKARSKAALVSASTGATVHTLRGHRDQVRDIRFSPDGSLVGSHSDDGELIVWDTATGRPLERWDTSAQWGVGFSPDGDLVYEGGGISMLRTWDRSMEDTYLQRTTQVGDAEMFAHADVSPDGQQVAYRWVDARARAGSGSSTPPPERRRLPRSPDAAPSGVPRHLASRRREVRRLVRTNGGADGPRHHHGRRRRRTRTCSTDIVSVGVRRRRPTSARGRQQRADPPPGRRVPTSRGRWLRVCRGRLHPDRGREHRDGPRVVRRRHLGALAGDRRRAPAKSCPRATWTCLRTPRLPLRTARRWRWRGRPARS